MDHPYPQRLELELPRHGNKQYVSLGAGRGIGPIGRDVAAIDQTKAVKEQDDEVALAGKDDRLFSSIAARPIYSPMRVRM